jgi:predicted HAD superfamily Cof-like phosphohydrolase
MKRVAVLVFVLLVCSSAAVAAQRRGAASGRQSATAAKAAASRREAANRLIGQITTISNFLYVYGGVAHGIEMSQQTAKDATLPPATQALIEKNKAGIVESIRNLEDGLRRTEMDFADDPDLKVYYQQINKLSEDVGLAADAAASGKYDDAGKRLVGVVEALARALLPETK